MSNPQLLMKRRETWQREFVMRRNSMLLGVPGWYTEFVMFNSEESQNPLFTASTDNAFVQWLQDGVIRVTVPVAQVNNMNFDVAGFFIRTVDPTGLEDPSGRSWLVCSGTFDIREPFVANALGMRQF